jgi:hypothetical protein
MTRQINQKLRVRGNKLSLNFKECDHCKCIFILHIFCPLKYCMHDGEITLGCTEEKERDRDLKTK